MHCLNTLRAYSFCAVFLMRFLNRIWNWLEQKERLSFERNNFHGNKMVHSLISNRKEQYKKVMRTKFEKIRVAISTDALSSPTTLIFFVLPCQSPNACVHGYQQEMESCCYVNSHPFRKEKRWKRWGTRRGRVCCAFRSCGGTLTKVSVQEIVFQTAHEDKEKNENVDAPSKKKDSNPLVCSCIANHERFSTNCRVPTGFPRTINRHKPRYT